MLLSLNSWSQNGKTMNLVYETSVKSDMCNIIDYKDNIIDIDFHSKI